MKVRILIALPLAMVLVWFLAGRNRDQSGKSGRVESVDSARTVMKSGRVRVVREEPVTLPPLEEITQAQWADVAMSTELSSALVTLAQTDRDAALGWLEKAPGETRGILRENFACAFVASDPSFVIEVLSELAGEGKAAEIIRQAAMEFASQHPEEAIGWAKSQPDDESRALVLGAVLSDLSQTKGAEAAEQLDLLPVGLVRDRTTVEVVQRWAQQDIQGAAAYAVGLGGRVGVDAVSSLVAVWASTDRGAAELWVGKLAPGDLREAGEIALAGVPKGK